MLETAVRSTKSGAPRVRVEGVEYWYVCPWCLLHAEASRLSPLVIVDAARTRLDAIRASHGSETNLKRYLLAQIAAARDDMLRFAGGSMGRPYRLADSSADPGR